MHAGGSTGGSPVVWGLGVALPGARRSDRLERERTGQGVDARHEQHPLPDPDLDPGAWVGQLGLGARAPSVGRGLAGQVRTPDRVGGQLSGSEPLPWQLVCGEQLDRGGTDAGTRPWRPGPAEPGDGEGGVCVPLEPELSGKAPVVKEESTTEQFEQLRQALALAHARASQAEAKAIEAKAKILGAAAKIQGLEQIRLDLDER